MATMAMNGNRKNLAFSVVFMSFPDVNVCIISYFLDLIVFIWYAAISVFFLFQGVEMILELQSLREVESWLKTNMSCFSPHKRAELAELLQSVQESRKDGRQIDPDMEGEILRSSFFVGEGLGAYSNFDLHQGFCALEAGDELHSRLVGFLFADFWFMNDDSPEALHEKNDETSRAALFSDGKNVVAWWWDGDGTLLVGTLGKSGEPDKLLLNDDCKKTYGWRRLLPNFGE